MENNSQLPSIVYPSSLRSLLHLSFYFTFVTFLVLCRRATVLWTCSLRRDFIPRRMISLCHSDYYICYSLPSQMAYRSLFPFHFLAKCQCPLASSPFQKTMCQKLRPSSQLVEFGCLDRFDETSCWANRRQAKRHCQP